MSGTFMTRTMRTPISHATTVGFLLGVVQAVSFALQAGGALGMDASAFAVPVLRVALVGFVVGTLTWWLFVARREPSRTSVSRGVLVGALIVVISTVLFPITQLVTMLASGMRTESGGSLAEAAGEGALLGVAGVAISLVMGWMNLLVAMIAGGMVAYWYRRGASSVPPAWFPQSEQATAGTLGDGRPL